MADYTKNKIFNMALKNLGVSTSVQNATSNDRNIVVLEEFYDTALSKILSDHDWSFASCFRELTPSADECIHPKYLYQYDYPNNCIKLRQIFLYDKSEINKNNSSSFYNMRNLHPVNYCDEFEQELFEIASNDLGRKIIYSNINPAIARFTRYVKNEALFPAEFAIAFSWCLAFFASQGITNTRVKTSDCLQLYKQMLIEAKTVDSNEQFKKEEFVCDWIEARN